MKYSSQYCTTIEFTPWFDKGYKLKYLHMYEELGGAIAKGVIEMEMNGSDDALELMTGERTGHLTITREEGGVIYEVDIFVMSRRFLMNTVTLNFLCIPDGKFVSEKKSELFDDLQDAIESLYPGNCDIRCDTDIQGDDLKYYRCQETAASFLVGLCKSFKKQSIFAYGWEGLLLKETVGKNSVGKDDPGFAITGTLDKEQIDGYTETYYPELYNQPYNPWEDTDSVHVETDYTDYEPINIRAITRYGMTGYVRTPYQQLYENRAYNDAYYNTSYFQSFRIVEEDIPNYKLGDVVFYLRNDQTLSSSHTWPYTKYLVKSNEFFVSADGCDRVDFRGRKFSFITKLLGLEQDGSVALDKDVADDPVLNA